MSGGCDACPHSADSESWSDGEKLSSAGHLFAAEDEAQEWPELHAAIRNARTRYQAGMG